MPRAAQSKAECIRRLIDLVKCGGENKFYNWAAWRSTKLEVLTRDNNECQICKAFGRYRRGDHVHHRKELTEAPELAFTLSNLITLCHFHHDAAHGRLFDGKRYKQERKKKNKPLTPERW